MNLFIYNFNHNSLLVYLQINSRFFCCIDTSGDFYHFGDYNSISNLKRKLIV
jgi:hypothetical protein